MIKDYISDISNFPFKDMLPWEITSRLEELILQLIPELYKEYVIKEGVAIHKSVQIDHNVTIKAPAIICENSFIGANAYLRNGVFMAQGSKV